VTLPSLIARVLVRGPKESPAFIAGLVCRALVYFMIVAAGVAGLALAFVTLPVVIRYAAAAFLLYFPWTWRP
jgi:threonine/homoserine/homoserine lactone efflux protein